MPQVRWLPEALLDLERLHAFLNEKSPSAAARAAQTILAGVDLLKTNLEVGSPMHDETGRRELYIRFGAGAYVIRYRIEEPNVAVVIRVWHSREERLGEQQT